jgi:poly-gamma-glutamate synthesis protein (capsule biosynthesis protein)
MRSSSRKAVYRPVLFLLLICLLIQPSNSPKTNSLTLALLGDIMLGRGIQAAHPVNDMECALAGLLPTLKSADLALANLESPLTSAPYSGDGFDLRASPGTVTALASSGLDILSLANNHILDEGQAGLNETKAVLQSHGLAWVGPESQPIFRRINGIRLAFLSFEDISSPLDLPSAIQAVGQAKSTGAIVVVSIHWGIEYQTGPNQRQQAVAQALVDSGASLIWGHHPHVLQSIAWLKDKHTDPALVAYSLGNALFDQITPPDARRGALLLVTLNQQGIQEVKALPLQIDPLKGIVHLADQTTAQIVWNRLGPVAKPMKMLVYEDKPTRPNIFQGLSPKAACNEPQP